MIDSEELKYYLAEEIVVLTDRIKAKNRDEKEKYNQLFESIKERIEARVPDITVEMFGSFATGLNLELSDIDIVLIPKGEGFNYVRICEVFKTVYSEFLYMTDFIK